jgi:hypothetical protein
MTPSDKIDLQVSEDKDGSAMIEIPENEIPEDKTAENDGRREKDDRLQGSAQNDVDDGEDIDPDPEREAIRQARREERKLKKQIHREKGKEANHLISMLKRQNEQMAQRVAELEKRTAGADSARLDKAIEDATLRLQYAKMKIADATKNSDGDALVEAQEAWYDARRNVEALEATKKRGPSNSVPQAPDPRLKKHASDWMARNAWYDPNAKDTDSKIAVKLDEELVEEGWDPTSEDYWEELDNRISKYLPHRTSASVDLDDEPTQPTRRPRAAVTGSGRESSSNARPGDFRLSPERVKAIKDAGKWDNPAERQKMARRYAEYDRNLGLR